MYAVPIPISSRTGAVRGPANPVDLAGAGRAARRATGSLQAASSPWPAPGPPAGLCRLSMALGSFFFFLSSNDLAETARARALARARRRAGVFLVVVCRGPCEKSG